MFFLCLAPPSTEIYTLSLHDALPIFSNVVTDAASGVVDIFHGIDKAVADTWNNFWKDGKADGIGSTVFPEIVDRKSGSAGMPRPISYAVFCLKKKKKNENRVTNHKSC